MSSIIGKCNRAYKTSRVPHIDSIPLNWSESKIKHVASVNPSLNAIIDDNKPVGYVPMECVKNGYMEPYTVLKSELSTGLTVFQNGDIVLAKVTPCFENGNIAIAFNLKQNVGFGSSELFVFRAHGISTKYLFYFLQTSGFMADGVESMTGAAGLKRVSPTLVKNYVLPVPPMDEQEAIVSYIEAHVRNVNEAISRSKAIIEKLIEYRKSVITQAVTKWGVTTQGTQKTHIPEFPIVANGFTLQRIKFLLSSEQNNLKVGPFGSALPSRYFVSEGIWVYNQRTVLDNNFETNDTCISPETYNALKGFEVYPGDIILTTRGTIGKAAIVPPKTPLGILHPCLIRFRVNEQIILREYVLCILNDTSIVLDQIKRKSGATTIEALYSYALKDVTIPVPPIREQKQILSFVKSKRAEIDDAISRQQTIIEKLEEYKKSLIYNAVTGKIDCRKET